MPVSPRQFVGAREAPVPPPELLTRKPLPATGVLPPELAPARTIELVAATETDSEPEIGLERVGGDEREHLWRISVGGNVARPSAAPIGEARRVTPEELSAEIDASRVDVGGHRPTWLGLDFSPRVAPRPQRMMRRIDGRPVRPLLVFGSENRHAFYPTPWSYPWCCVGKVEAGLLTPEASEGTGFLVGDNLVITAAHVIPWNYLNKPGGLITFTPAYWHGTSTLGWNWYSAVAPNGVLGYKNDDDVTGYDWALLRLVTPLGKSLGCFGYNGYLTSWNKQPWWTVVGYPLAVASGMEPSWQGQASVVSTDVDPHGGLELETFADATEGNSGGPMFGWWGNDPRAIGTCSGEELEFFQGWSNVFAGGSGFTNLIAWGRQNWKP